MKRKRGRKTGKKKDGNVDIRSDAPKSPDSTSTEKNKSLVETDDALADSAVFAGNASKEDANKVSSSVANSHSVINLPSNRPAIGVVYGRVKVKLKPSKGVDSNQSAVSGQASSIVAKSNEQNTVGLKEVSVDTSSIGAIDVDKVPRKVGSIKIKSRGLNSIHGDTHEKNAEKLDDIQKTNQHKSILDNVKQPAQDPCYNEKELNTALEVIHKVMKMDAAEPFNTPVDPVALGIPDYFDVINTPMDFGTICHDLERRQKYMNSKDVLKDVQFIWDNCSKYNNKGDYVVDLMKRVKKAFMKHWLAAGLYSDENAGAVESANSEDILLTSYEKMRTKGKGKHKGRRHGSRIDRHKSDCMCAVCAATRRRKERGNSAVAEITAENLAGKLETNSPIESSTQSSEESLALARQDTGRSAIEKEAETLEPNQTSTSVDNNAKKALLTKKIRVYKSRAGSAPFENGNGDSSQKNLDLEGKNQNSQHQQNVTARVPVDPDAVLAVHPKDAVEKSENIPSTDGIDCPLEYNSSFLRICSALFPGDNEDSVWKGSRSLLRTSASVCENPFRAAVSAFMRQ